MPWNNTSDKCPGIMQLENHSALCLTHALLMCIKSRLKKHVKPCKAWMISKPDEFAFVLIRDISSTHHLCDSPAEKMSSESSPSSPMFADPPWLIHPSSTLRWAVQCQRRHPSRNTWHHLGLASHSCRGAAWVTKSSCSRFKDKPLWQLVGGWTTHLTNMIVKLHLPK